MTLPTPEPQTMAQEPPYISQPAPARSPDPCSPRNTQRDRHIIDDVSIDNGGISCSAPPRTTNGSYEMARHITWPNKTPAKHVPMTLLTPKPQKTNCLAANHVIHPRCVTYDGVDTHQHPPFTIHASIPTCKPCLTPARP